VAINAFNEFSSREELATALSAEVARCLDTDMETGHFASIALSGGSTPKLFLEKLGQVLGPKLEMIYFSLVDERFVPPGDERSNESMIKEKLGLADHPESEFLSLYRENVSAEDAAKLVEQQLLEDEELPFDVLTLGMGLDGHTASFFPGGDTLAQACDPKTERVFMALQADGAPEPRITLTLPPIVSASNLILHIEGAEKRAVYEKALEDGPADELPIRHIIRHPDAALNVYWAP